MASKIVKARRRKMFWRRFWPVFLKSFAMGAAIAILYFSLVAGR